MRNKPENYISVWFNISYIKEAVKVFHHIHKTGEISSTYLVYVSNQPTNHVRMDKYLYASELYKNLTKI